MFPACLLLASLTPAADTPTSRLVEGKFGKALDAAVTPLAFAGDERYRTPPLTVECWAKLQSKRDFNVLVSSDPKSSSRHWEIYSYAGSGRFAAYLPGYAPSEVVSKKNITDREWHHLAMTFDGALVRLFVDGKKVHEQLVKPRPGPRPEPGPLSVGQAIDGGNRIGCDGLIDDVRLSRVAREVNGVPAGPLPVDADTVALWRFDGADTILADPAWTPPPVAVGEPWERETDPDWVDARLRKMDTGPTFNGTLTYPHGKGRVTVYKATAIRIGDKGQGGVIFDRNQLRLAAAWTGGYLQHSDRRFGLLNTPTPVEGSRMLMTTPSQAGWAGPDGTWRTKPPATLPLPHEWGRFEGMYLHGKRVVLEYKVGDAWVLESPWLETIGGKEVLTRSFEVGPSKKALALPLNDAVVRAFAHPGSRVLMENAPGGGHVVRLPAADHKRRFTVYHWPGAEREGNTLFANEKESPGPAPFARWTKPGPARWGKPLVTRGEVARDTAPYVVDTLTVPYENPYHALMFTSGLDFLPDGRIAVCTAHGDVWLVTADDRLEKVSWQRFATGLYHPLGLKVVDGKVVVLERGQLTRLHDTNGDGEADYYENVCHDWHTGAGEHSYDSCLETDAAGNFYFFKTGDTDLPHGGCLLKVSPDGKSVEVFATGFRHPVGLGVSPEGAVTGADQEGNWMPVTRVDVYKKGGFYGDMRAHHRATPPTLYDGPLVWLPKDVDNSAGGQAWVPHDRFGFPKGQMLHLSYGRCTLHALLTQKVGDVEQAGAVSLGVKFLSGAMRMRFHPANGHLYVCGLRGWQTAAVRDGCLQRVRYTGQPIQTPIGLSVSTDGVRLDFAQKLTPAAAEKRRYLAEQWNYRWSADYGSKRWSVRHPDRVGQDTLAIDDVVLSEDGKSVLLKIKGLAPVMQLRVGYDVETTGGGHLKGAVHSTIHRVVPR
ncbi:MAG: DUF6797 domain-containing protein [Gemmataceae bacterium]